MNKSVMSRRVPGIMILAIVVAALVVSAGCGGTGSGSTPTAALKAYLDAGMKKDIPTLKKYLSSGSIKMLEAETKKMGKSLDEALKEDTATPKGAAMPELSNEKITGDTATVDMKAEGMTISMPMVKEGGEWKVAMDKMLEEMKKSLGSIPEPVGVGAATPEPAGNANEHDGGHEEK